MTRRRAIFIYLFLSPFFSFFFFWFIDDIVLFFIIIIYRAFLFFFIRNFFPFFIIFQRVCFLRHHFSWRQSEILFLKVPESYSMLYIEQFLLYKLPLKRVYNLCNSF